MEIIIIIIWGRGLNFFNLISFFVKLLRQKISILSLFFLLLLPSESTSVCVYEGIIRFGGVNEERRRRGI